MFPSHRYSIHFFIFWPMVFTWNPTAAVLTLCIFLEKHMLLRGINAIVFGIFFWMHFLVQNKQCYKHAKNSFRNIYIIRMQHYGILNWFNSSEANFASFKGSALSLYRTNAYLWQLSLKSCLSSSSWKNC